MSINNDKIVGLEFIGQFGSKTVILSGKVVKTGDKISYSVGKVVKTVGKVVKTVGFYSKNPFWLCPFQLRTKPSKIQHKPIPNQPKSLLPVKSTIPKHLKIPKDAIETTYRLVSYLKYIRLPLDFTMRLMRSNEVLSKILTN